MSVSASLVNGIVTLASGTVEFDLNGDFGTFKHGLRIEEARIGGVALSEQSFTFLKIGHRPKAYWAGIDVDAAKPKSRQFGYWHDLEYGTRTIGGAQEAYARAQFTCRNPLSDLGENVATAIRFTMRCEFVLRDGASYLDRSDSFVCDEWYHVQELTHTWQLLDSLEGPPNSYLADGWQGRAKHVLEDGEALPSITGPATVALDDDRLVGLTSLDVSIASGNAGAEVEWTVSPALDLTSDRYFSWRLKTKTASDVDDAIRFYIKDSVGGKQYLGVPVGLIRDLTLDADKQGHTQEGIWRQSFRDLNGLTRASVTAWGFDVLDSGPLDFLLDDVWVFLEQTEDLTTDTGGPVLYNIGPLFPDGFVDTDAAPAGANPNLVENFDRTTNLPLAVGFVEDGGTVVGACGVMSRYRDSVAIGRQVITVTDPPPTVHLPHVLVRLNARMTSADLSAFEFKARFGVTNDTTRDAAWATLESQQASLDASPVASKSSADLPDANPITRLFQNRPASKYENVRWLRDLTERLGGTDVPGVHADAVAIHRIFRNPHGPLIGDDPVNTVLDTKQDLLQAYVDVLKPTQRVVFESTAAIYESERKEIPHYRTIHQAGLEDGTRDDRLFFVYRDAATGFFILRKRSAADFPFDASVYDDITEDGRTYELDYTYPAHLVNFASLMHRATDPGWQHGSGEPTVGDQRYASIEFLVENYDLDAVAMAEDAIYYARSFAPEDLFSYNYWRQNVRVPTLGALTDFDRLDNGLPVGPNNPYKQDDQDLWDWKDWLSRGYIAQIRDLCHSKGVQLIVDVNVATTIPVQDETSPLYDSGKFLQAGPSDPFAGEWHSRDFDASVGSRHGIHLHNVLDACDLLYVWLYGAYTPWGAVSAFQHFLDWAGPKHYHGRMLLAPGLYPREARVPSAPDTREQLKRAGQQGWGAALPSGKVLGQFVDDYWRYVMEGFSAFPDVAYDADTRTLTVVQNQGVYFPKAVSGGPVTVAADISAAVYHYDRAHTLQGTHSGGDTVTISAGDSLYVEFGDGGATKLPRTIRFRSKWDKGYGPVHDVLAWIADQAGLPPDRLDTRETIDAFLAFSRSRPSTLQNMLDTFRELYLLDIVESQGVLKFVPQTKPDIAGASDLTADKEFGQVDLRDPTTGAASTVSPIAVIAEADLGAREDALDGDGPFVRVTRLLDEELPQEVQISFLDPDFEYQTNTAYVRRLASLSRHVITLDYLLGLRPDMARQLAERLMYTLWMQRTRYQFAVPRSYFELDPGDELPLNHDGRTEQVRLDAATILFPGLMQVEAKSNLRDLLDSAIVGGVPASPPDDTIPLYGDSLVLFLNLPALRADDLDAEVYLAVGRTPGTADWRSAVLWRSNDGGATYVNLASFAIEAVHGTADNALPDSEIGLWDEESVLSVTLVTPFDLISTTRQAVLASGENALLVGSEIIGFTSAVKTGANTFDLSGLIRGLRGTDVFTGGHTAGETVVLLSRSSSLSRKGHAMGVPLDYKAVSFRQSLNDASASKHTNTASALKPFAPIHVRGQKNNAGDWAIGWTRQTRAFHTWSDSVDAPLLEEAESYEIDVLDGPGGAAKRTIRVDDAASITYTAAQQTADFGSIQASINVKAYQIGVAGRGFGREVTL